VAFRELKRLELELLIKMREDFARPNVGPTSLVSTKQFYGIDINSFAVELAKVTLMLAKELAVTETTEMLQSLQLGLDFDQALPLDNLDDNIRQDDALFCEWPKVKAIVGNPPYQSKNKLQQELGRAYVNQIRDRYPEIPGRADYCVYWFRRAHDELAEGDRAGLVGTNTIRQNYSREGGLDYIVNNGGTITEAVSTQVWSGDAAVHVSIVDWKRGSEGGKKKLYTQLGDNLDSPWDIFELEDINSSLSARVDVAGSKRLLTNGRSGFTYQGQTHGHKGFLVTNKEAQELLQQKPEVRDVLFPYLTAEDMIGKKRSMPSRHVIDFHPKDIFDAQKYPVVFDRIRELVLPARQDAAEAEERRNKEALDDNPNGRINHHHRNFLNKWWLLSYPREDLMAKISDITRYIACGQVTKRPIFEFIASSIHPNAALQVFTLPDDYSFGILQSGIHWEWFTARCSTLTERFRYTSDTVFDTFPWPQSPAMPQVRAVSKAAVELRALRRDLMQRNNMSLRELYRTLELPGRNPLKDAHSDLDRAVRAASGMKKRDDPLAFLLDLNIQLASQEASGEPVVGPGLPPTVKKLNAYITKDCVKIT